MPTQEELDKAMAKGAKRFNNNIRWDKLQRAADSVGSTRRKLIKGATDVYKAAREGRKKGQKNFRQGHHDTHPSQPARLQAGDRTWAYAE